MTKRPDILETYAVTENPAKHFATYALELEVERDRLSSVIKLMVEADKNLMANFRSLEKRLQTADALLGEVEWLDDDHTGTTNCFGCGNMKEEGHASDCKLNAYIQEGK